MTAPTQTAHKIRDVADLLHLSFDACAGAG